MASLHPCNDLFFFWTLHKILSIPLLFIQHLPDRNFLPFILLRLLIPLFIFILETFASLMKSTFRNVVSAFHNAITAIIVCRLWLMCLASSNFIGSDCLVLCSAVKMTVLLGYCLPCRWSSALSTLRKPWQQNYLVLEGLVSENWLGRFRVPPRWNRRPYYKYFFKLNLWG